MTLASCAVCHGVRRAMQQPTKTEGYDASAIDILRGLTPRRRPWQLLLTGDGPDQLSAEVGEALARILDLFPSVSHLVVRTTGGSVHASRDFPSGHTRRSTGSLPAFSRTIRLSSL